jgi:hypothetical protein
VERADIAGEIGSEEDARVPISGIIILIINSLAILGAVWYGRAAVFDKSY